MADPNGPYSYRNGDGDNDILRKILNWFSAISSGSKPFPVTPGVTPNDPGALQFRALNADQNPQDIKAGGGNIYAVNFINPNTTPVYVKFYDEQAGDVTVGTTAVALTMAVPAGDGVTPGIVAGSITPFHFSNFISFAVVTGLADNSTAAPASDIHVAVTYR